MDQELIKKRQQAEQKSKINDYINDMFDMDYHFLRQVGRCLDTKNKQKLKKPKAKITKKTKKQSPLKSLFSQSLEELQAQLFPKNMDNNRNLSQNSKNSKQLVRRFTNSPSILIHSSSQQSVIQVQTSNNFQSTQQNEPLSSKPIIQHSHPPTAAQLHQQARPFSGIRNNLFDPLKFFNQRKIKAYPSLSRDYSMTLIEKIGSYGGEHRELTRYDLVKMKSSSPYSKQSMLKEFRSGNYRITNSDSNTLKEAPLTNNQQQTISRDQEIDDFLFNDQQNPNDQSTIVKNYLTEEYNPSNKSFHTPMLKKRQMEEAQGAPSRIFSMNTNFKFQNTQAFKKSSLKNSKSNPKLAVQQRIIKEHKPLIILNQQQLEQYERVFLEDYFSKKQVQKQLLRSMTHSIPDEANVKKIAINIDFLCEDQFVNDKIMYIVWKNFNNKQYFVISEPEILDRLDQNIDDEKIYDSLLTFNLDIKYQVHDTCIEKKQEDQEFNEMLMNIDSMQEQSNTFLEFDLIQYVVQQGMLDESRSQDQAYFNEQIFKIRRPCHSGVIQYINAEYFSKRYDYLIQYLAKRKIFDFKDALWVNDNRICLARDKYKNQDNEQYCPTKGYLFQRAVIPSSEIIKILFQPNYQLSIFYLLFNPDEDYELLLTIDRILQEMQKIDLKNKPALLSLASDHPKILLRKKMMRERHKSLGYVSSYRLTGRNLMIQDSIKSDTSFRSSVTHKFSDNDNSVSQSDNEQNKTKESIDVDLIPILRKNAMRRSRRKLINKQPGGDQIKHKVFKARIGSKSAASQTNQWSHGYYFKANKTSMMAIENFDYTSEDDDDESDSSSSSISYMTGMNYIAIPKRLSNISKNSEQISLFTPIKGQQYLDVGKRDFTVQIQVGNLGSQKQMPQVKKSTRQKKMEKRASRLLKKMGSMDGILIDKFGYESVIRVDDSRKFLFEVFQSVEIKQDGSLIDTEQQVKDHSDDHLTTDSSLRDQGDDKFTDFDTKIQKQQLRKFFQQQKLRQKLNPRLIGKPQMLPKMTSSHEHMLVNQMTIASGNTGNSKNGKSSLVNLTQPYTTIGNYYKNLTKKKKVDRKEKDVAGEVISAEEFIEDDENNFYLQMRINIKIMELLNEGGANKDKQTSFLKSIRKIQKLKKNEFKEDFKRTQKKIMQQQNSVSDSDQKETKSLFSNSDEEEKKQHELKEKKQRKNSFRSFNSKNVNLHNISQFHASNGSIHSNTIKLNLSKVSNLKRQSLISMRKCQILRKRKLKDPNAESLKKNLYMRDQAQLEQQIIQCVVHQDLTNFKQMLHKFDESLDTYRDPVGNTLLSISTQLGNKIFVELLLQSGADPNIQNDLGNVPLHYSICNGFNKITDLLMEFGANERIINTDGKAPWDKFN